MGTPLLSNPGQIATKTGGMLAETIPADGKEYKGTFVCMGNPHVVIFVDDIKEVDLPAVGPKLENHPLFPERTNVEFVEILPDQSLRMRVWERGSGITMACGTGACATAVAAVLNHKAGRKSWVRMDGGDLHIHWNEKDGHVYMTGPAGKVFRRRNRDVILILKNLKTTIKTITTMALVNEHFLKLPNNYLFSDIAKKVNAFKSLIPKRTLSVWVSEM